MTLTTHVHQARERVEREREVVQKKATAFDRFITRVESIQPATVSYDLTRMTAGRLLVTGQSTSVPGNECCRKVRTAFADTVLPHCRDGTADVESLLETIGDEFTEQIALALAPTTQQSFTPDIRKAILSEAADRTAEVEVLQRALKRETESLSDNLCTIEEITNWLMDVNEISLSKLDFTKLQKRHETLETYRQKCAERVHERQTVLHITTNRDAIVGLSQWTLIDYLYRDFPIDYPVLATIARLDAICTDCQRTVRDHLVRRI